MPCPWVIGALLPRRRTLRVQAWLSLDQFTNCSLTSMVICCGDLSVRADLARTLRFIPARHPRVKRPCGTPRFDACPICKLDTPNPPGVHRTRLLHDGGGSRVPGVLNEVLKYSGTVRRSNFRRHADGFPKAAILVNRLADVHRIRAHLNDQRNLSNHAAAQNLAVAPARMAAF